MNRQVDFQPAKGPCDLLVVAGEASGDEHASRLIKDLLHLRPQLQISALGGEQLKKSGTNLVFPLADYAVVGLIEVIKNYGLFKKIFEETIKWIEQFRPRCLLLVDYPGFNLRLARELKDRKISNKGGGSTVVLQYISPQLWAWKPRRRFKMAATLDSLGVIFPFEEDYYADVSLPVYFVGHPFSHPSYRPTVCYDKTGGLLLLPGSRLQPVSRILPSFLDAFEILVEEGRNLDALLPVSNSGVRNLVSRLVSQRKAISERIKIVEHSCNLPARVALMSSGTMSLSCALAGIPGVIGYKAHPLTYIIGKLLVKVSHLGMANILLSNSPPNPEFLQGRSNGPLLAKEIGRLLDDSATGEMASENAGKLHHLLAQPKELSAVEWLIQDGRMG